MWRERVSLNGVNTFRQLHWSRVGNNARLKYRSVLNDSLGQGDAEFREFLAEYLPFGLKNTLRNKYLVKFLIPEHLSISYTKVGLTRLESGDNWLKTEFPLFVMVKAEFCVNVESQKSRPGEILRHHLVCAPTLRQDEALPPLETNGRKQTFLRYSGAVLY